MWDSTDTPHHLAHPVQYPELAVDVCRRARSVVAAAGHDEAYVGYLLQDAANLDSLDGQQCKWVTHSCEPHIWAMLVRQSLTDASCNAMHWPWVRALPH